MTNWVQVGPNSTWKPWDLRGAAYWDAWTKAEKTMTKEEAMLEVIEIRERICLEEGVDCTN